MTGSVLDGLCYVVRKVTVVLLVHTKASQGGNIRFDDESKVDDDAFVSCVE